MKIIAALSLLLAIGFTLHSNAANAHSSASKTIPASGETAERGLDELSLLFAREVRITSFKLVLIQEKTDVTDTHPDLATIDLAALDLAELEQVELTSKIPRGFEREFELTFDDLEPATYAFEWSAVAKDGDVIQGRGHFWVAK